MNKLRFEKLLEQNKLYLLGANTPKLHFYVMLHSPGHRKERYGIFQFDPDRFRSMSEQDATEYIKKCRDAMRREEEKLK